MNTFKEFKKNCLQNDETQNSTFNSRNSLKKDKQQQQNFTEPKNLTSKPKKLPSTLRAAKSAASDSKLHNQQPLSQGKRSEAQSTFRGREHCNKKMSDWGDEETTEVIGKGFGNNNDVYKPNNDDDYQNEDDNNRNDNYKKRFNGGDGGGRGGGGRNFGGRGRGGGRNGNGFNRHNKDNDDNEENGESNDFANIVAHEHIENSIFALTPKNFLQESLKYFMLNMPELFRKASLVQKYTLLRYLMEAYERVLKRFNETNNLNQRPAIRTKEKNTTKQNQKTTDETVLQLNLRSDALEEDVEMLPELLSISSSQSSGAVDLLQIFHQDLHKDSNESLSFEMQENIQNFQENLMLNPLHQQSPLNISDFLGSGNLNSSSDDLQMSFLKLQHSFPEQQQQQQHSSAVSTRETIQGEATLRRSERLQVAQNSACAENLTETRISAQRIRHSSNHSAAAQIPPANSKRTKPRTFITENEYSLRFRLPRRKFIKISELPHIKFNIETSSFSHFSMDITLIEEEYFGESVNVNNLAEANTPLEPQPLTISALATTTSGHNFSSLNVVRHAPSSLMEFSSFAKPMSQHTLVDISRVEEERRNSIVLHDMSPRTQPVGLQNKGANVSFESATSLMGAVAVAGESPLQPLMQDQNLMDEGITLPAIDPPQTTTDSGIQFPISNLLTTSSALLLPSFSRIDSEPSTAIERDGKVPLETPSGGDTGIYKTPIIPNDQLLQPTTTLFSETNEQVFQKHLSHRSLDVSTPLNVLKGLQTRKTLLSQIEAKTPGNEVDVQNRQVEIAAVHEQPALQTIEEKRESVIRPSTLAEMQNEPAGEKINPANENVIDDDYRKDWYEILRVRLRNNNYENTTTLCRKPKHRRKRRLPLTQQIEQPKQLEQQATLTSSNLLQQTLAGILPPLTSESPAKQNLNTTTSSRKSVNDAAAELSTVTSLQQQQYDNFILDNAENITLIMNNLNSCRIMLENKRRAVQAKINSDSSEHSHQHFDPNVLINANKTRLFVKLGLLQNIIRQVSFDFTKCDFIKNRMSAAIGFAFLLELKSAGIIHLSSDGRIVSLQ